MSGDQVTITKRNHYNPCFWTAYWNPDYYRLAIAGKGQILKVRTQRVHVLNVKSARIHESSVGNIHLDKHLGVAEISREAAENFALRHHPDLYEQFLREDELAPYPVYLDFEPFLSGIERTRPYQVLIDVAKRGAIQSAEEKVNLGCFVVLHQLRGHAIMNSMIEWQAELQRHKFELFIELKWLLESPEALFRLVHPLVACQWTLFATASDTFPLCDSPILVKPHSIMVALSPRLLLEIQPQISGSENAWRVRRSMELGKLTEFRRRTIGNTFREIIFGDRKVLERWHNTPEFRSRIAIMKDLNSYNRLIAAEGSRELWKINAWGNT